MILLYLLAWVAPALASCQSVEGNSILARDFVPQVAAFSTLAPDLVILAAPLAGVERVVSAAELLRLTRKLNLPSDATPGSACFTLASAALTADDLIPVLKAAFPDKDVKIEILSFTTAPLPAGRLQFARSGLEPSGLWHGRLVYGPGRSASVWARVLVSEERRWVEAAEVLPVGQVIRSDQLVLQAGRQSPLEPVLAQSLESVVGKKPLRAFASGTAIRPQLLIEPPQVERGDKVSVLVSQGGALLKFDAEVESPGHVGDLVFLRNPENGHRFKAKVEGKGKVAIRK